MRFVRYLEARLGERSFWGDVLIGISAAAVLPSPWCWLFAGMSAVKALIPDAVKAG